MMRSRSSMYVGVAAGAIAMACSPTDTCGCSFPAPSAELTGVVRTESGTPLAGVALAARGLPTDCSDVPDYPPEPQGTSDTDGSYRVFVFGFAATQTCAEIVAVRTVGETADTLVTRLVVDVDVPQPPPVALDLVFPG